VLSAVGHRQGSASSLLRRSPARLPPREGTVEYRSSDEEGWTMTTTPARRGRGTGAATLDMVAAMAGVSRTTASRVVNGDPRVAAPLRAAVEDAVARLNFVPNQAARSLATRRTNSVALLLREPAERGVADPYLSGMIVSVNQALAGTGIQLVVLMPPVDESHLRVANYLRSHVDGAILVSLHDGDALPVELARSGLPLVSAGRLVEDHPGVGVVDCDNAGGARLATQRLLESGRRTIAVIAGPPDMTAAVDRLAGFRAALRAAARPVDLVAYGDFTSSSGERAMRELLEREPGIDGVFAASDVMAMGALHALRSTGRVVPDDVGVVGFDDVPLAEHASPPLTTVRQPAHEQARVVVETLLARIGGAPAAPPVVLPTTLVLRSSG
jgi:DNA-binding LacI/PurR family transcriptional regulator